MTGFWDGVYFGIRDDKLDKEVVLRLIDVFHELDHGSDHDFTGKILEYVSEEDYDTIMDVIRLM